MVDENNFILELRNKNEEALEYVIKNYGGLYNSVVKKYLYNFSEQDREACICEIFLTVWENIESFNETKNSFKNWSCGVARYKSLEYYRKHTKHIDNVISIDFVRENGTDIGILDEYFEDNLSDEVRDILKTLSDEDREIFVKLYLEDRSMDEVSSEMGISKAVIYNRVSRGKKKLRKGRE